MSRIILVLFCLSGVSPASAQIRTVVVPVASGVVIAPRGQVAPRPSIAPATRAQRRVLQAEPADTLAAPTAVTAAALAAAAAVAVLLGGSGGGGGTASASAATTRTR